MLADRETDRQTHRQTDAALPGRSSKYAKIPGSEEQAEKTQKVDNPLQLLLKNSIQSLEMKLLHGIWEVSLVQRASVAAELLPREKRI